MLSPNVVLATAICYVAGLFALAYFSDRYSRRNSGGWLNSPVIYTLAISVYCTSWTFYGAVGSAARNGLEFLTIYLGPTLIFVGWWYGLRKLVHIGRVHRITSIADFISSRYGKSTTLAVMVTLIAVISTTPYIALQLKAVTTSIEVMTDSTVNVGSANESRELLLAFWIAVSMAIFTILFGTRNIDAKEQHHGVVAAIAFEAVVKLIAIISIGLFVVFGIGDGFGEIFGRVAQTNIDFSSDTLFGSRWVTILFLSGAAIICLPRQFQITVVENSSENQLRTASWMFPLYLLLMSIFTLPIAIAGLTALPAGANPDMFVLTLPLSYGHEGLAMFAFIGGFSSATSMVIVASIALSIMVSNHIVLPLILKLPGNNVVESGGVKNLILVSRRISICLILFLGFLYLWLTQGSDALAPIGLIAFAGVAQFLPAILAALFWRGATRAGAIAGLLAGFTLWAYTNYLPSFASANATVQAMLDTGPFGIALLRPQSLFGLEGLDPMVHSVFWSMLCNISAFVLVSLNTGQRPTEQLQATLFVDTFSNPTRARKQVLRGTAGVQDLYILAQRILGTERATVIFMKFSGEEAKFPEPTPEFITHLENEFTGSIGAASAHVLISQIVSGDIIGLEEVMQIADETQQVIEYSQQLEEKSDELQRTAGQLQEANEQLREMDSQKDNFLSQISHEVRTPMTAIRSVSEILLDDKPINSDQRRKFLSTIHEESIRLTRLLDEILDLNVLERGEMNWHISLTDVGVPLQHALDSCAALAQTAGVEIQLDLAKSGRKIMTDSDRLCQVFINIISNAIKYNDSSAPIIRVTSKMGARILTISVEDNGPGIREQDRARVFESFKRGSGDNWNTRQGRGHGAGLGLAISLRIIQHLEGKLSLADSRLGGALFTIDLPVESDQA